MKKILISILVSLGCAGIAYASVPVTVPSAPGANYVLLSNTNGTYSPVATSSLGIIGGGGGSSTPLVTTSQFYIDGGRNAATYPSGVASGTIQYPYTSISQAIQNINMSGVGAATIYIAPAYTYIETNITWPNIPTTIYADKSQILTGGGGGTGTITFPNQFVWNGGTIIGNVNETDGATTTPHTFEDDNVILGNLTCSGLCTLLNGATQSSLGGATTTIYLTKGSLMNILGENVTSSINDAGGTLNLNDDQVITNTSQYAVLSTTTGSSVEVLGLTLVNSGGGGGINAENSASSVPNNLNNIVISEAPGAIPIINNGSTATILNGYNAYSFTGVQQYAQGSGYIPSDNIGLQSDGTTNLGQNQGGIQFGTTTVWNPLIASSSLTLSYITGTTSCLEVTATGTVFGTGLTCGSGGSSAVNSVTSGNSTLTISPTTGSVIASLNLANNNVWTGGQIFGNSTTTSATSTNFYTTNLSATGTVQFGGIMGTTSCLQVNSLGILSGTGATCGSGGGGTNYFSNSGATTTLTTGSILATPILSVSSTTATSTITNLRVSGTADIQNLILGPITFPTSTTTIPTIQSTNITSQNINVTGAAYIAGNLTATGTVTFSGITGSTQCLQINSGVVSGTGSACGSGGGGTPGGSNQQVQVNNNGAFAGAGTLAINGSTGYLNIGATTTPSALVTINASTTLASTTNVETIASSSQQIFGIDGVGDTTIGSTTASTTFMVNPVGHIITGGLAPAVSGGSSVIVAPSNDSAGQISVIGTALTSVTLTFANSWKIAPICVESDNQTAIGSDITSISTTTIVFGFGTGGVTTATIWYRCEGVQ